MLAKAFLHHYGCVHPSQNIMYAANMRFIRVNHFTPLTKSRTYGAARDASMQVRWRACSHHARAIYVCLIYPPPSFFFLQTSRIRWECVRAHFGCRRRMPRAPPPFGAKRESGPPHARPEGARLAHRRKPEAPCEKPRGTNTQRHSFFFPFFCKAKRGARAKARIIIIIIITLVKSRAPVDGMRTHARLALC